ncbi:uncharacterized protein PHACADRAFT_83190 [Phanerochaete carnosa HHB-10118-sp]|uniref:FMR1-interacting protein 1 conserved domain-containing protein n=1 Tax=Phanerochaete carnosa (strain HHB-10118-sp) TaxID=650164 RepID=K5VDU4_PHACS|nr:uncharacterized protein PHACADRAFT_83190 [Phanerochaete carnosa HHB-10118-sp]EKM61161.1 hypothetical protein PHACADRAFT_83190 [Phanerochaete carnosa HHB-10118-sp]
MNSRPGLPTHPSLPRAPHLAHSHPQAASNAYSPYQNASPAFPQLGPGASYQYYASTHYAQAYTQNAAPAAGQQPQYYTPTPGAGPSSAPQFTSQPSSRWAQPGTVRCKKPGCLFTASHKSVEIHMMDRHLIYPPGWENRKGKNDWDADPSLKGKPIMIQGTIIKLDTPETIEQWIAERKRRFPTADRVEEKRKKIEEAVARGQLSFEEARFPNKRRRINDYAQHRQNHDTRGRGRGRGRGHGRGQFTGKRGSATSVNARPHVSKSQATSAAPTEALAQPNGEEARIDCDVNSGLGSDSDSAPAELSSKATHVEEEVPKSAIQPDRIPVKKLAPKQPRRPPQNPFVQRPALLRNLLLPEIRMTVSNFSQAIRFLVDNEFLENVELRPGQAQERMIEVISTNSTLPANLEQEPSRPTESSTGATTL